MLPNDGDVCDHARASCAEVGCPNGPLRERERKAREILDEGLAAGEQRALLRKEWTPRRRSGGEILLAQRMARRGMFEGGPRWYVRTDLGQTVLDMLTPKMGVPRTSRTRPAWVGSDNEIHVHFQTDPISLEEARRLRDALTDAIEGRTCPHRSVQRNGCQRACRDCGELLISMPPAPRKAKNTVPR